MRWLAALFALTLTAAAPQAGDQRSFMVTSFDRIRIDGPFQVEVVHGSYARAVAEGDARSLQQVSVRVEGDTLVIGMGTQGWELRSGRQVTAPHVRITAPALRTLLVNGGGSVHADTMHGDKIDLGLNGDGTLAVDTLEADTLTATLTGTGGMRFAGQARAARLHVNGAGTLDAGGFTASDAVVISETTGTIALKARYSAQVMAFGTGTVQVGGPADCSVSGSGPVACVGRMVRR
jgi:hypothetical protein